MTGAAARATLPRSARLITNLDFKRVYGRGRRLGGRLLVVVAQRRRAPGHRLGLSVSREHGSAVRRNKLKRILREAFRLERATLPGRYDVVLIPRAGVQRLRLDEVRAELTALLGRIEAGEGRGRDGGGERRAR